MMKTKLTKLEKYWVLYDVGNSAFILLVSTIIPIYYNSLAEAQGISSVDYLATWGYAASFLYHSYRTCWSCAWNNCG